MTLADVQFYDVVKWLHITAVVLAFGPTFAFGIYIAVTQAKHPRSIPAVLDAQTAVVRTMVTGGMILILLTGIYLVADGPFELGEVFVGAGILVLLVLFGLSHGFFVPNDRRTKELAERDIEASGAADPEFSDEYTTLSNRSARVGMLAGILVVLTIYMMTAKPFL
jgi:uncharacterized membrane protein